ncbi:MAG: hypothetical protein OEZ43_05505 [Gammaproteobacteria bacterium]|nr:hypothetical protein [Gammaproteobacteria bacterium]
MIFRKSIFFLIIGSVLSASAFAEKVDVAYGGSIVNIYDPYGVVSNITLGEQVYGSYKIDTLTQDSDPTIGVGRYVHASEDESMVVNIGGMKFSSSALDGVGLEVNIQDEVWAPNDESYYVMSWSPMTNGDITIDGVNVNMYGVVGGALDSELLTAQVPDIQKFDLIRSVFISGSRNGEWFSIELSLDMLQSSVIPGVDPVPPPATLGQYVYRVVAQVSDMWQSGSTMVTNNVSIGDTIELFYTIDTNIAGVQDVNTPPLMTMFDHPAGKGAIEVKANNWSAITDKITAMTFVDNNYGISNFHIYSETNIKNTNSFMDIGFMSIDLMVNQGQQLFSDGSYMITDPILLNSFTDKNVYLSGKDWSWTVMSNIVSIELVSRGVISVVPSDGNIHHLQRFDAAIYVEGLLPVTSISGQLNGVDVSNYLQACVILPYKEKDSVAVCPDMHQLLAPGENRLDLHFGLSDLSVESTTVNWTMQ